MRLQRILIKLQLYELVVSYKPGKELYIADTLSRVESKEDKTFDDWKEKEIEISVEQINKYTPITKEKWEEFRKKTELDKELNMLNKCVRNGWPEKIEGIEKEVKNYGDSKELITENEGILYKANRIIVPRMLRKEMLEKIHFNHMGVEKCKFRARSCLYWPGMNKEI